jgi:uncharacterized protein YlxP (DUF503 family)
MFIGIAKFELFIPASASLKDKRRVVRSVTGTLRAKFNIAVAEVDHQDLWQRAAVGTSCIADSTAHCRKMMQEIEKWIARSIAGNAEIIDSSFEVVSLEDL